MALGEGQGEALIELQEIDLETIESPVLRRLIEEVRAENMEITGYDRVHNRHNRGGSYDRVHSRHNRSG